MDKPGTPDEPEQGFNRQKTCRNCGYTGTGNYCASCGQSFIDIDRPLKQILSDLVGMFNLDSSIFRTLYPLFFKPGFLSSEYLAGRRIKYLSTACFHHGESYPDSPGLFYRGNEAIL